MIISFTGSHSTGKSTLVEFFRGKDGFVCLDSCTRSTISAEERRVDGVQDLNFTQLKMLPNIVIRMADVVEMNCKDPDKVYLMDRCVFDFLAYSKSFAKRGLLTEDTMYKIEQKCEGLWNYIDIFYYLPIEFNIVDDGIRSLDESLRKDVDREIRRLLFWNKVRAVELTGPVLERVNTIKKDITLLCS